MNHTIQTITYSSIAGFSTILGIHLIKSSNFAASKLQKYLMPFAAGIILAVAFFHLIPEAMEFNKNAIFYTLIGFLLFYLLESGLLVHSGPELHHIEHTTGEHLNVSTKMALIGLLVHATIDGLIIGLGFKIDETLGIFTTVSIIIHKLPEGIATYSLMAMSDPKKKALIKSYIVALATPVASIVSLIFFKSVSEATIGILLAFTAGTFIYIAAADIIPETHNHKGFRNIFFLLSGVLLIFGITELLHH